MTGTRYDRPMRRLPCLVVLLASAANAAPCLSVAEAQQAASGGVPMGERLTPPLPVTWPPSGVAAVRFFDFRVEPLPTGVVAYSVDSPSTEFTVPLDGTAVKKRALKKPTRLGRWEPPLSPPSMDAAKQVLLRVVCEARAPTDAEAVALREGYAAWLNHEPLVRDWLAKEAAPFFGWLAARPAGAKTLTARIDGEAVVMTRDGVDVRFERPGVKSAQLVVVPLRADGSDLVLWISLQDPQLGPTGLLVEAATPPRVLATVTYFSSQRGIGSTSRSYWLLDVDGDGVNELVEHATSHTDVGSQNEGARVLRYDGLSGRFTPGDRALEKRAPPYPQWSDYRVGKRIATALKVPSVDLRGRLDAHSRAQPSAPPPDTLQGSGTPPFVGADGFQLVLVRKPNQMVGGQYHLVHLRYGKEPVVASTLDLGVVTYPPTGCKGRREEFRREADAVVVVWPSAGFDLVEQRVPWDGKALGKPVKPPVKVASCAGLE